MTTANPYTINLLVASGNPNGPRIISKSGWDGIGVVFSRDDFGHIQQWDEMQRAGVYVLWEDDEFGGLPQAYIGESASFNRPDGYRGPAGRIYDHTTDQQFWSQAVVFTSEKLNTAHTEYLEARLINLALDLKQCQLINTQHPAPGRDRFISAEADGFLENILLCLPLLGVNFFDTPRVPPQMLENNRSSAQQTQFQERRPDHVQTHPAEDVLPLFLNLRKQNGDFVDAQGYADGRRFVVLAGSRAAKSADPDFPTKDGASANYRNELIKNGVLVEKEDCYEFKQPHTFNSPSRASAVCLGNWSSGPSVWKDEDGNTLQEIRRGQ